MDTYYVLLICKPCVEAVDLSRGEASFFFYCPVLGANHLLCHLKNIARIANAVQCHN